MVFGLPPDAKFIVAEENEVFRQYRGKGSFQNICQSSELIAGNLPYVVTGFGRQIYMDITGIFITRPNYSPIQVGVDPNTRYYFVDFKLPKGTQLLQLTDSILVIPGPAKTPDWLAGRYKAWLEDPSSVSDSSMLRSFSSIERRGGIKEPHRQKIILEQTSCPQL